MKSKYWLSGSAIAFTVVTLSCFAQPVVVSFDTIQDAKAGLMAAGFFCTTDTSSEEDYSGFLVSHQSMTWREVGSLCKVGKMGDAWRGKVWVTTSSDDWQLAAIPDNAGVRYWGSVVAFGDEEILKEIEAVSGR